MCVGAF